MTGREKGDFLSPSTVETEGKDEAIEEEAGKLVP